MFLMMQEDLQNFVIVDLFDIAELWLATGPIYVSWKKVEKPKIGCHVYGIVKDKGASVDTEGLGIVIGVNPTIVVQGDASKGVLVSKKFIEDPKYVRTEYIYLDF